MSSQEAGYEGEVGAGAVSEVAKRADGSLDWQVGWERFFIGTAA